MLKNKVILLCLALLIVNQLVRAPVKWYHFFQNSVLSLKGLHEREIHYQGQVIRTLEGGQGPTLILVHEETGDSLSWYNTFDALLEHFHVVSIDLAGHGGSSASDDFGYGELFKSLALIRERYQEPVVFVASGLNSRLVVDYLIKSKENNDRVALISPLGILNDKLDGSVLFPTQYDSLQRRLDFIDSNSLGQLPGFISRNIMERQDAASMLRLREELSQLHSVEEDFSYLSNRIDLIWGEEDQFSYSESRATRFLSRGMSLRTHLLSNCGYAPQYGCPSSLSDLIVELYSKSGKSGSSN